MVQIPCRRLAGATAIALSSLLAAPLAAEPVGDWAPLVGLLPETVVRLQHMRRSRCLPEAAEVRFPVYPHAAVVNVQWGRVRPLCKARDGWAQLGGVVLISADDPAAVRQWYAAQLPDYFSYEGSQGVLFIAARIADFLWDRDYFKHPNVAVKAAEPEWAAAGYQTRIELNRPAP